MGLLHDAVSSLVGDRAPAPPLDILDLRHFNAEQLRPLLNQEVAAWQRRLHWDYAASAALLLEYIDERALPGFAALRDGRLVGYAFAVVEAEKAILGDVFAFGEAGEPGAPNPVSETLLHHLLDMLQATPGVDRIESQLLLYPAESLSAAFATRGFRCSPRLFMSGPLDRLPPPGTFPLPDGVLLERWRPELYDETAALIHSAYLGHVDSGINDQYRSLAGSQRFLHNITRFPGCGLFEPTHSWILRRDGSPQVLGVVLTSRIHERTAHITQICVARTMRGRGVGHRLLAQCATHLRAAGFHDMSLTVTAANTEAIHLYEAAGLATAHRFDAWAWQAP